MSENLYQLGKGQNLKIGDTVTVNGPHDKYGIILSKQESGYFLIRGLGFKDNNYWIAAEL